MGLRICIYRKVQNREILHTSSIIFHRSNREPNQTEIKVTVLHKNLPLAFSIISFSVCYFLSVYLEINLLWAAHQVHHGSESFNLTTAMRQSIFQGMGEWVISFNLIVSIFSSPLPTGWTVIGHVFLVPCKKLLFQCTYVRQWHWTSHFLKGILET